MLLFRSIDRGDHHVGDRERARAPNREAELNALHQQTKAQHLFEFWSEGYADAREHESVARLSEFKRAIPHLWRYAEIEPLLFKSAELIDMRMSERRSLIMTNPALEPLIATVSIMFVAYRINNPNEIAPAHRHSPKAIRLGLTGRTNFTCVEGKNITFGPGDLVLTPHDTWHNHGNEGDAGAVNLSVLDMPLVNVLHATYFELDYYEEESGQRVTKDVQTGRFPDDYSHRVYGQGGLLPRSESHQRGAGNASPMFVYRWEQTRDLLDRLKGRPGSRHDGVLIEYIDPTTGRAPYATMTFFAQLLRPGEATLAARTNASQIYTVLEGRGHSVIGDRRFDWRKFDTFCVPGGEWCAHFNETPNDEAIFIVSSDEPVLKAVRLYLRHGKTASGEIVPLAANERVFAAPGAPDHQ